MTSAETKPAIMQPATRAHRLTLAAALSLLLPLLVVLAARGALPAASAAEPGLPFTEDFTTTDLRDDDFTNALWSVGALQLTGTAPTLDPFGPTTPGLTLTADVDQSTDVALGDVNGDGYLDVIVSNCLGTNRLYLNNGTVNPFAGVTGMDISSDMDQTRALALGDVDGDGDLDLVVGNTMDPDEQYECCPTRLYFNNGSPNDPFGGAAGHDVPQAMYETKEVVLQDMDGDGDLDLVTAAFQEPTWLYLNNGTADPFAGVIGQYLSLDTDQTKAMTVGDVDGDGDLDVVIGNENAPNKLFLNNGTAEPFSDTVAITITLDADPTRSLALGDVNGDGHLDLVAGNDTDAGDVIYPNKLYLNNGTADPFSDTVGIPITDDTDPTWAVALGDVDGDGDLDLMVGNFLDPEGYANRLYLNTGTADPFAGISAITVSAQLSSTKGLALGDLDWDGDLDLVTANWKERNAIYLNEGTADLVTEGTEELYDTARGRAASLPVNGDTNGVANATLTVTATLPANTGVTWWLSNNDGAQWFLVQLGVRFEFPTSGSDLRWRAELHSLSPILTPRIDELHLIRSPYIRFLPLVSRDE